MDEMLRKRIFDFLQSTFPENKDKIAKADQGLGEHGGEPVFEGLKNVNESGNGEIPSDKPSDSKENENVNELGEEAFEGLENVNRAHNVDILNDNPSSGSARRIAINKAHIYGTGSARRIAINKAHNVEILNDNPSSGSARRIAKSEEVDGDTSMDEYQYSPTPEVNNRKETLQPRFVDHNADVGDMPEIKRRRTQKCWTVLEEETLIKGLEKFGTGNWMAILKTHSDIFEARTNNDLRDKWRNMCRKGSARRIAKSEEVDGDTSMDEYQYSPTPEVNNRKETLQPRLVDHNADVGDMPEIKRRRTRKCWTVMEEETLIKGLEKFGTGNWMAILKTHSDIFEARTNNDLRDKWRNMCRKGVY